MNPKRLFVGNLTYSVDEKQLWGLFSRYGEVVGVRVIEGKGYGFVEMESYEDARAARNALNETEFQGRNLLIDDVRPPKSKTGFQTGSGGKVYPGRPYSGRSGQGNKKYGGKGPSSPNSPKGSPRGPPKRTRTGEYSERVLHVAPHPRGKERENEQKSGGRVIKSTENSHKYGSHETRKSGTHVPSPHSVYSSSKSVEIPGKKPFSIKSDSGEHNKTKKTKTRFWPGGKR